MILVNGKDVPITRNLHGTLQFLRCPSTDRGIGIDAICINQADIAEKTH